MSVSFCAVFFVNFNTDEGDLKAMDHFKTVVKLSPEYAAVHYRLASIHKRLSNKEEESNESLFFRELKVASDDEKRTMQVERSTMDQAAEKFKKRQDIEPDAK